MLRRGKRTEGEDRDYRELSFAAGDKIFVPVEQITRISRYSGAEKPQLSKLGGTEWERTKRRVRRDVASSHSSESARLPSPSRRRSPPGRCPSTPA